MYFFIYIFFSTLKKLQKYFEKKKKKRSLYQDYETTLRVAHSLEIMFSKKNVYMYIRVDIYTVLYLARKGAIRVSDHTLPITECHFSVFSTVDGLSV